MKLVMLDWQSLRPADLDASRLRALPLDQEWHDHTFSSDDTAARLQGADIAVCNKVRIDAAIMDAAPQLRLIAVTATGTNNIDLAAASARGITVANVPSYGTAAVAQHTFALLLALCNRIPDYARAATDGRWSRSATFCLMDFPVLDLAGKKLGIVGYGQLGRAVARLGEAFGMQVLVAEGLGGEKGQRSETDREDTGRLPLVTVLREVDVLSLHCLLSPRTEKLISADTLARMKPTALLLNTSRGGLIDEPALAAALRSGRLAGAALDVLSAEPPPVDHPLLAPDIPNLLITPHCAWVSQAARQRLLDVTADNIAAFLDRRPTNP